MKDLIYIAAGYGLGSGIMVDGKVLRGNKGYASEVGHMTYDPKWKAVQLRQARLL